MTYTLRRTWTDPQDPENDYVVVHDGKDVGRLYETLGVDGLTNVWQWTIYGTNKTGREPTMDAAKARWRTAYEGLPSPQP